MFVFGLLALVLTSSGCARSAARNEVLERERLELETQAQRDAGKANQAITDMNRKLGRKPPPLDLGLPTASRPAPASEPKSTAQTPPKP